MLCNDNQPKKPVGNAVPQALEYHGTPPDIRLPPSHPNGKPPMSEPDVAEGLHNSRITFSKKQNRIISYAVSLLAMSILFVIICLSLFYSFKFISLHSSVLLPPIVAIICAKVVQPAYDKLRKFFWKLIGREMLRLHTHRRFISTESDTHRDKFARGAANFLAILVLFSAIFVPLGMFFWFFGKLLVDQILALINAIPSIAKWIVDTTREKTPQVLAFIETHNLTPALSKLDPQNWFDLGAITSGIGGSAFTIWGNIRAYIGSFLGWVALPVYTAIYLASRPLEGSDFSKLLVGVSEKTQNNVQFLIDEFIRIVVAFFRGQVMVALIQGLLFGLGFQLVAGLNYGIVMGLLLGLFNIVPYLGNIIGLPVIGAFALLGPDGGMDKLGLIVLIFMSVQMIDSFFITPKVIGNRTGLNAFVVIFSLFFWGSVIGGALGMVLAIPLSAFIVVFWRLLAREYFMNHTQTAVMLDGEETPAIKSDGE